jgi:predicted peroxiredoxin
VDDDRLLFNCTHGSEAPERATVPFIAANVAAVSGRPVTIVCTIEAVRIGTPGYAETIEEEGMPPLIDLVRQLLDAGGELWLCSACTTKRGITGDDVIDGAEIVGAARIVEALTTGRAMSLG